MDRKEFCETEHLKKAYGELNITMSEELVNKTLNRCKNVDLHLKRKWNKISVFGALAASFVILFLTMYTHFGTFKDATQMNVIQEPSNHNTDGGSTVNTPHPGIKADFLLNFNYSYDRDTTYTSAEQLKSNSTYIIECELRNMVSTVVEEKGRMVPVTEYTLYVLNNYKGSLSTGQEFKILMHGGIFNYGTVYEALNLSQNGLIIDENKRKMNVEFLSDDDGPNLKYDHRYILFMNKDSAGNYAPTGYSDGIFNIDKGMVSRYVSKKYSSYLSDLKMNLEEFLDLIR